MAQKLAESYAAAVDPSRNHRAAGRALVAQYGTPFARLNDPRPADSATFLSRNGILRNALGQHSLTKIGEAALQRPWVRSSFSLLLIALDRVGSAPHPFSPFSTNPSPPPQFSRERTTISKFSVGFVLVSTYLLYLSGRVLIWGHKAYNWEGPGFL